MRMYDTRLGRFFSVDPITHKYPYLTPYQFASNTPIQATDLDGLEAYYTTERELIGYGVKGRNGELRVATKYTINEQNQSFVIHDSKLLNSQVTLEGRNEQGSHSGIRTITSSELGRVVAYGKQVFSERQHDISDMLIIKDETVGTKSNGGYGLLDFKYVTYDLLNIDKDNLLEINGVVYNANEAGNYLWGAVLEYTGASSGQTSSGWAEKYSQDNLNRPDEPHDQKAIKAGEQFGKSLRNASSNDPVKSSVDKNSSNSSMFKSDSQSKADVKTAKSKRRKL